MSQIRNLRSRLTGPIGQQPTCLLEHQNVVLVHEKQLREGWFDETLEQQAETPVSVLGELNQSVDDGEEITNNHEARHRGRRQLT